LATSKSSLLLRSCDSENFGFQYLEAPVEAPFLKLSTKVGELGVWGLRIVSKTPKKQMLVEIPSEGGIGLPYNAIHADHKNVESLLSLINPQKEEPQEAPIDKVIISLDSSAFLIELGKGNKKIEDIATRRLMDADKYTPYYQHYFLNKPHINYFAESSTRVGPVLVSLEFVQKEAQKHAYTENEVKMRALVRTKFEDEWVFIPVLKTGKKRALAKAIESQCRNGQKLGGLKLKKVTHPDAAKTLGNMEQKLLQTAYKFGVLYARPGQSEEEDMFANVTTSPEYDEFLEFLGDKIVLQGWEGYRGGLDVKSNTTGTNSVFTTHCGFDVMFHVSTLLPYFPQDKQQLERKRHLGNDVCVIIFKDSDEPFAPDTIKSEFNHVFAVITPHKGSDDQTSHYRVAFAYKGGVGMANPLLPNPAVFAKTKPFREFLLTKLINSERSSMYAPNFVNKIAKTKELQMLDAIQTFKEGYSSLRRIN